MMVHPMRKQKPKSKINLKALILIIVILGFIIKKLRARFFKK
jgi:hypothetical protein